MGVIKNADIVGYRIGEEIICCDCVDGGESKAIGDSEITNITQDNVITQEELEKEETYFCDRCKKQLQ